MSNNYEMMYILRPDLSEDQVGEAVNKYKDYLSENGAENFEIQVKGKRRLAYPIGKYLDGIYVQMNYQADGTQIAPLERMMRLGEEVIRYLTLKLKKRSAATEEEEEESEASEAEVEAVEA
jgi:small subunit ribosomal protein S6